MAFCGNCGTQVAEGVAYCPKCGKPIAGAVPGSEYTSSAPPQPATPVYTGQPTTSGAPLADNIAGMLAYFTIIPAIVFLLVEPYNRNRFVRFHSFQCLFTAVALIVVQVALLIISTILHYIPVIGWIIAALIWPLYGLCVLGLWLLLVIKAYQGQMFKLPFVGDMAEKQAGA
jgi:uncharacterized membrane protein